MAWSILLPFCCSKSPMSYESEYSTSLCLVLFFTRHVQTPSSSRDPHLLPTVPRWCWTDYPSSWLVRAFPSYKLQPGIRTHVLLLFRPRKLALWMITLVELRKFHINKQGANFISFQFKRLKKTQRLWNGLNPIANMCRKWLCSICFEAYTFMDSICGFGHLLCLCKVLSVVSLF